MVVANEHFLAATHIITKDVRRAAGFYDKAALRFFAILWNPKNILKRGDGMLEKIFSFGKTKEKQSDDTTGRYRTITEEEYQLPSLQ